MIGRLNHVAIVVPDVKRAAAVYRDTLGASVSAPATLPPHGVTGKNDFGTFGWGGPCPPPGQLHRYVFTLFALDPNNQVLATAKMVPVYKR